MDTPIISPEYLNELVEKIYKEKLSENGKLGYEGRMRGKTLDERRRVFSEMGKKSVQIRRERKNNPPVKILDEEPQS